jgi:hypothetical protein
MPVVCEQAGYTMGGPASPPPAPLLPLLPLLVPVLVLVPSPLHPLKEAAKRLSTHTKTADFIMLRTSR